MAHAIQAVPVHLANASCTGQGNNSSGPSRVMEGSLVYRSCLYGAAHYKFCLRSLPTTDPCTWALNGLIIPLTPKCVFTSQVNCA